MSASKKAARAGKHPGRKAGMVAVAVAEPPAAKAPALAVIMPAYGHPVLLTEALESALAQNTALACHIVVVSDGCTMLETDTLCRAYARAYPNVIYLRQPNGGPSSARNHGINFALRSWPEVAALFFLDADNRLAPGALDDAWAALRGNPQAGWVYTSIDSFGVEWNGNYGIPYAPLVHIAHNNICDTGSLVRRAVFEAGIRFDEDRRAGYEDWDFFLQALGKGFYGQPAAFGFAYRQRPESRYREMNHSRDAQKAYLGVRHRELARASTLLRFEHERDPRYMLHLTGRGQNLRFTDPAQPGAGIDDATLGAQLWAALAEPDAHPLPPFFVWGSEEAIATLTRLKLLHNVFWLLERGCGGGGAALVLREAQGEIRVAYGADAEPVDCGTQAVLWMLPSASVKQLCLAGEAAFAPLMNDALNSVTAITLHAPGCEAAAAPASLPALHASIAALRASPYATPAPQRWTWRPANFPARDSYVELLRAYLEAGVVMPRLARPGVRDIGVLLPIASFGGADKVAYAMARNLRQHGARVHLFVLGAASMKLLPEYEDSFDTISFMADPEVPVWGGNTVAYGQELFLPGSPELKQAQVLGLLAGLDSVINCHCAPVNAVMGGLRRQGMQTATYLHLMDTTPLGRAAGHPLFAVAFEHAYNRILTCSNLLAGDLHALGVPEDKIIAIRNAAGFEAPPEARAAAASARALDRGSRPLRVLYLGRLDQQKGIARLYEAARAAQAEELAAEWRIVGGSLVGAGSEDWGALFAAMGVAVEPPVYGTGELAALYAWADVLVLPSYWEGAPLVIPECHSLGCIPLVTRVGAVEELLHDDVDGLLVESGGDHETALAILAALRRLVADDGLRRSLAEAGLAKAREFSWERNFAPLRDWLAM